MDVNLEELRRLSRAAFNQTYRLEVMLYVAESEGLVTQTEVARALGLSVSNVQAPTRSLIECGLLTPLPKTDNRSLFLARTDSPAWDWARQLRTQAANAQAF
ncbi:DNA-binding IclR family transcriptional regulator [Nocardioides kongjuensis]|uniref:DNA-binding IclR family transcriptional regulator n=1 Tax=Nocardioides kongjuensis TaxID=349522 RepID=A0A852RV08_9ACTN|nr:DNA-binding IclR family transcriptional regulator [Nocardioides kongjuensis]